MGREVDEAAAAVRKGERLAWHNVAIDNMKIIII
jgi:hypothetical protein